MTKPGSSGGRKAGDEDRTRIIALEGRGSTIELPPRGRIPLEARFADGDSLHKPRRRWRSRREAKLRHAPGSVESTPVTGSGAVW